MEKKERFISLCKTVNREGMDELLKWLEENGFYACPASSRYHGAYTSCDTHSAQGSVRTRRISKSFKK